MTKIQWILGVLWMLWPIRQMFSAFAEVPESSSTDKTFFVFFVLVTYVLFFFAVRAGSLSLARIWRRTGHAVKQAWVTGLTTFALLLFTSIMILRRTTVDLTWSDSPRQVIGGVLLVASIAIGIVVGRVEAGVSAAAENDRKSRKRFNFDKGLILGALFFIVFIVMYGHLNVTRIWDVDLGAEPLVPLDSKKPNVVLITIDTLASYNVRTETTPTLMRLAGDGVSFPDTLAPVPITCPSHATILSGLSPQHHMVLNNANRLPDEITTIAEVFRDAGYNTAAFTNIFAINFQQGFRTFHNRWRSSSNVQRMILAMDLFWISDKQFASYNYRRKRHPLPEHENLWVLQRWLETESDAPFFLWFHTFLPHVPYAPPAELKKKFGAEGFPNWTYTMNQQHFRDNIMLEPDNLAKLKGLYNADTFLADRSVEYLTKWLYDKKMLDNTILVITADHGETFQAHNSYIGHAVYVYEDMIRVPLIIRYPPEIPATGARTETIANVDIMPTILDLADLKSPTGIDGKSFADSLRNPEAAFDERAVIYSETIPPEGITYKLAVRRGDMKYIYDLGTGEQHLYDVAADVKETNDLAADPGYESALEEMRELAKERMNSNMVRKEADMKGVSKETLKHLRDLGYLH